MFIAQSPFERVRRLLADVPAGAEPIDLTIGSPRHEPPSFIAPVIAAHLDGFASYPPIAGTAEFRRAVHGFLDRRYGLRGWFAEAGAVLPLSGSREGLFLAAVTARDLAGKADPVVLYANPFYQAYVAAPHAIGARALPTVEVSGSAVPDLSRLPQRTLERVIACYVAAPSNPQGCTASLAQWHALFDAAERHGFFVFADECYSEIYRERVGPPVGALQAARERPAILPRLLVFNSLSKRSNLPGLRAGFVAGHPATIEAMRDFRNQAAPQVPTPLQAAAAAAYDDDAHVACNRRLYDEKYADAARLLTLPTPPAGFFLWLPVGGDDAAAAARLWREAGVRAVPGSYLATTPADGDNPGAGHLRLALVADAQTTREALVRIARALPHLARRANGGSSDTADAPAYPTARTVTGP